MSGPFAEDVRGTHAPWPQDRSYAEPVDDKPETYAGRIVERDYGEATDILFLDDQPDDPLAERIEGDMESRGRTVSVAYFITDEPATKAELEDNLIRTLSGDLEAEYTAHYSEYTGYLWTDQELRVGGHDLLGEIQSHVGKYLHLEITYGARTPVR